MAFECACSRETLGLSLSRLSLSNKRVAGMGRSSQIELLKRRNSTRRTKALLHEVKVRMEAGLGQSEVAVYFRFADVLVYAKAGDKLLEVAEVAGVTIPSSCCSGSCGSCEVEVTKVTADGQKSQASVVRACVAGIPPGFTRLDIDEIEDPIWGTDGWDT
eukprot:jgi/Botrbrau1/9539/Bobra.0089s0001.1